MNLFRYGIAGLLCLSLFLSVQGKEKKKKNKNEISKEIVMNNSRDSVSFCLGNNIGNMIKMQGIDSLNFNIFLQAFEDALKGADTIMDKEEADKYIGEYFKSLSAKKGEKNLAIGKKFLEENKMKEGVVTLESGLQYIVLEEGKGEKPKATDKVVTHYHGTLIDGTVFDSSRERGQPITFEVNRVIPGWTEALQLMKVGAKWKLFVPDNLAYGDRPMPGGKIEANSTLIFEVELISIAYEEF